MSTRAQGLALHPAGGLTEAAVEARRRALEDEELGLTGTMLVEPLTALAGGIIGGVLTMAAAWALGWRVLERRAAHRVAKALR